MYKKDHVRIILQTIRMGFYVIMYPIVQLFVRTNDKYVLFLSDSRNDFSGNFAFVRDELVKRNKYKIIGIFKKSLKKKRNIKDIFRLLYYFAKCKYIFVDDFYPAIYPVHFRKNKRIVQLWHAMGAYKTVGYARMGKPGGPKGLTLTHRNYTDTIVSSESIRKDYAKAFGISIDKVHAWGIPRTDIFFDEEYAKNIKKSLYKKYPKLKNKKVILFAPTFRGVGQGSAYYDFNWIDLKRIKKEYSKDYVCIFKLHPFIKNRPEYDFTKDDFYLDLSSEREINDLLFITDVLITDYSSVIFEYSLFERPVIFFTPDYDDYIAHRDFFYDFDKYNYGIKATNMDELIEALRVKKVDTKKIKEFKDYFCSACDGKATKRVVDSILGDEK